MKLLVILILKWAHTASSFARLNFGDRSKLGGTRKNWPKMDQFVKFSIGKQDFPKISNSYFFSPVSAISLQMGTKMGLRDANKTSNLDF